MHLAESVNWFLEVAQEWEIVIRVTTGVTAEIILPYKYTFQK